MSTPTSTTDAEALIDNLDQKSRFHHFHNLLHKYPWVSPLIVLLLAVVIFGLLNSKFWGISNLSLITQQVSIVGTIAIAQTLVILTAGIDLSVGSVVGLSGVVCADPTSRARRGRSRRRSASTSARRPPRRRRLPPPH